MVVAPLLSPLQLLLPVLGVVRVSPGRANTHTRDAMLPLGSAACQPETASSRSICQ